MKTLIGQEHKVIIQAHEFNVITQYLQQILGCHVRLKFCLVSQPLIHVLFKNFCRLREQCFPLQIV